MNVLRMQGITKWYPERDVLANNHVDFSVEKREIHAIIGENGAGKTTLMKILYGLEHADSGTVHVNGKQVTIHSPHQANDLGIGMVHQHFKLIPELSVAENITLGREPRKGGIFLNHRVALQKAGEVLENHHFSLNPARKVGSLTVGEMQQVEIAKALYRDADLLILDEPTSVLTIQQVEQLFATMRTLVAAGKTVILITHKLNEVKTIANRVTVMRQGEVVAVRDTATVDRTELANLMIGRDRLYQLGRDPVEQGEVLLEFRDVSVFAGKDVLPFLDRVNFAVHRGEIVGIAGISGNGREHVEDAASGMEAVDEGEILYKGLSTAGESISHLRERGLAYVPADRLHRGSNLTSSVLDNMIVSTHHDFIMGGLIKQRAIAEYGSNLLQTFSINADLDTPVGTLSGGNIQKVVLSRELSALKDMIIFSEPTWGLDIASSEFIYRTILDCRERHMAVLLLSSNLDEIIGLSDTILVMYQGRIAGRFTNSGDGTVTKKLLGDYMLGIRGDHKEASADGGIHEE